MKNSYTFLKTFSQGIRQEIDNKTPVFALLLVLLSIPLSHAVNSICLGLLVISSLLYFKKNNFRVETDLLFPMALYLLMVLSYFWTIDKDLTVPALSKELSLLIIPLCFFLFGGVNNHQKQFILKYYSYGILVYAIYYLIKATIRYYLTNDSSVFFYHELVTKDVNAIHVSVYMALSFFYFFTKPFKKIFDFISILILLVMVFLLSSRNITIVFIGLIVVYHLFYSKLSKQMRLKNLMVILLLLFSFAFIGKLKDKLRQEYETIMTDSTVNDVISKENNTFYNVSIKQAWTNKTFNQNDFFPGTAFRVYQFRIFLEMLSEDAIFWKGYGLNASYPKIEAKGVKYHVYLGNGNSEGYQKKNFHNQYIQNFAELGLFGFLLLIILLFTNVKNAFKSKDFMHFAFAFLMISLFLTESFLWRQRGIVFFTMMYCLFNSGIVQYNSKAE
ncbi:O-antigen ligase family protein [Flavobacterium sp.]|uniref:O-antigen ligase family protein n=1 Tax=Flavobacterium sp. TaxID=239 RepID=UPI002FDB0DE5